LPKSFFAGSETFFDKSKARSRRFQNSPFGLKQLESPFFHFAKIYEQKTFQRALKKISVWATARQVVKWQHFQKLCYLFEGSGSFFPKSFYIAEWMIFY
jgi:hypothetical protein